MYLIYSWHRAHITHNLTHTHTHAMYNLQADEVSTLSVDAAIVFVQLPEDHGEGHGHGAGWVHLVDLTCLAQRGLDDVPIVIIVLRKQRPWVTTTLHSYAFKTHILHQPLTNLKLRLTPKERQHVSPPNYNNSAPPWSLLLRKLSFK